MKVTMFKTITLIIVLIMVLTTFIGCGQKQDSTDMEVRSDGNFDNDNVGNSVNNDSQEKAEETYTYKVLLNNGITEYPPDGGVGKEWILEKAAQDGITGIDFEVTLIGGSDYKTKLNVLIAGGDEPDYFHVSVDDLQQLVDSDVIIPLNEYLDMMPNYTEKARQNDIKNLSIDNNLYALPMLKRQDPLSSSPDVGFSIRTDWLENVGKSEPKTLEEFHEVLRAFTFDDPDKNGKDDTYGLGGHSGQYFSMIFGAYGLVMGDINSWMEIDGELVHSTTLPETKEVLSLLREWYSEGIIDPDKFVIKDKQAKDKFIQGQIGSWETTVWWNSDARLAWEEVNPDAKCMIIEPVAGPEGEKGFTASIVANSGRAISKKVLETKNVEQWCRFLDWVVNEDPETGGFWLITYGKEDEHYNYDKENEVINLTENGSAEDLYKLGLSNPVRFISVADRRWIPKDDMKRYDLLTISGSYIESPFLGSVPAMKDYPDLWEKLWAEYFTKIITGELELDAWDEYVERFYNEGGTELTEQVNKKWNEEWRN